MKKGETEGVLGRGRREKYLEPEKETRQKYGGSKVLSSFIICIDHGKY
jgi:hypothetical protein